MKRGSEEFPEATSGKASESPGGVAMNPRVYAIACIIFLAFMVRRFGRRKYLMLAGIMTTFILIGSTFGTVEGTIAIVPLTVALSLSMGWDSLVGVAMVFVAEIRGLAASTTNPFTVVLTQTLAGVPLYSGMGLRVFILAFTVAAMMLWILSYARRIEKDPMRSLMYHEDSQRREGYALGQLSGGEKGKYRFSQGLKDFGKSAVSFTPMIAIGALIMSLSHILTEGMVIDTIINRMALAIVGRSPTVAAMLMLPLTLFMELFLPGTYVKACLMFPILLPLGDIAGLSRQLVCQIFILGDTFANMFFPTDVMLMMTLGLIGCGYGKWVRWCWKFIALMLAFCFVVVYLAARIGYA